MLQTHLHLVALGIGNKIPVVVSVLSCSPWSWSWMESDPIFPLILKSQFSTFGSAVLT